MAKVHMTEVPSGVLRAAQQRLGYSDRDMATRLHLGTEKTWWRWRTEGRVPTGSLPAVALVLEMPDLLQKFATATSGDGRREDVSRLAGEVEDVKQQLAEVLELLRHMDQGKRRASR